MYEIKRWVNTILNISLWIIVVETEPYFLGKELALNLGFTNAGRSVADYVDDEDKMTLEKLFQARQGMTLKEYLKGGTKNVPPLFFKNL